MEKGGRSYRQRFSDALTNHIYVRPQEEMLAGYSGPVWRYEYRYGMPGSGMGCFHASELPVLFGLNDIFGKVDDPKSQEVGEDMRRIWSGFAHTGRAAWEEFGKDASVHAIP